MHSGNQTHDVGGNTYTGKEIKKKKFLSHFQSCILLNLESKEAQNGIRCKLSLAIL